MKLPHLLALGMATLPAAFAQDNQPSPLPPPPPPGYNQGGKQGPGEFGRHLRDRMLERLGPAERERFEQARKKALEDPKIQELRSRAESANREFFEAMRAKMNQIDPGLEEILKKAGPRGEEKGKRWKKDDSREGEGRGLSGLSDAERQRLTAARQMAKQTPSVQNAEQELKTATTPEERRAAAASFAKAMREAMLSADPSLGPVLDKIGPPRGHTPGDGGRPESATPPPGA